MKSHNAILCKYCNSFSIHCVRKLLCMYLICDHANNELNFSLMRVLLILTQLMFETKNECIVTFVIIAVDV